MKYYSAEAVLTMEFMQFPRWLKSFDVSSDAKLLYVYLLDRYKLSLKNKWVDCEGRVYLICTREEMQDLLGCGNQKATKVAKELTDSGLIIEKRNGHMKANWIYLLLPDYEEESLKCENHTSREEEGMTCENHISCDVNITPHEVPKSHFINSKNNSNKNNSSNESKNLKESNDNSSYLFDEEPEQMYEIAKGLFVNDRQYEEINELIRLIGVGKLKATKKSLLTYLKKLSANNFLDSHNNPIIDLKSYVCMNFSLQSKSKKEEKEILQRLADEGNKYAIEALYGKTDYELH